MTGIDRGSYDAGRKRNILVALRRRNFEEFLDILDEGFKNAAKQAAAEAAATGLPEVDGRRPVERAIKSCKPPRP